MAPDFTGCQSALASGTRCAQGGIAEGGSAMDDMEHNNGADFEDDDEQIEQMIIENGILLHSIATLLVRKGVLKQEEIDAEMDRLYDEMENFEQQ
jgi:hypothetical protein